MSNGLNGLSKAGEHRGIAPSEREAVDNNDKAKAYASWGGPLLT